LRSLSTSVSCFNSSEYEFDIQVWAAKPSISRSKCKPAAKTWIASNRAARQSKSFFCGLAIKVR
jgi:hypothetical protein